MCITTTTPSLLFQQQLTKSTASQEASFLSNYTCPCRGMIDKTHVRRVTRTKSKRHCKWGYYHTYNCPAMPFLSIDDVFFRSFRSYTNFTPQKVYESYSTTALTDAFQKPKIITESRVLILLLILHLPVKATSLSYFLLHFSISSLRNRRLEKQKRRVKPIDSLCLSNPLTITLTLTLTMLY